MCDSVRCVCVCVGCVCVCVVGWGGVWGGGVEWVGVRCCACVCVCVWECVLCLLYTCERTSGVGGSCMRSSVGIITKSALNVAVDHYVTTGVSVYCGVS